MTLQGAVTAAFNCTVRVSGKLLNSPNSVSRTYNYCIPPIAGTVSAKRQRVGLTGFDSVTEVTVRNATPLLAVNQVVYVDDLGCTLH